MYHRSFGWVYKDAPPCIMEHQSILPPPSFSVSFPRQLKAIGLLASGVFFVGGRRPWSPPSPVRVRVPPIPFPASFLRPELRRPEVFCYCAKGISRSSSLVIAPSSASRGNRAVQSGEGPRESSCPWQPVSQGNAILPGQRNFVCGPSFYPLSALCRLLLTSFLWGVLYPGG